MCKFKNLHNVSLDYAAFIAVNCSSAMLLSFGNAHTKWASRRGFVCAPALLMSSLERNAHTKWASRRGFVCAPAFLMSPLERNAHTKWIEGLDAYKYLENTLIYIHFSVR